MDVIRIISLIIVMLVSIVCFHSTIAQQSKTQLQLSEKSIRTSNDAYFLAFKKNDESLLVKHYAPDSWIMIPDSPTLCGPDATNDFFRMVFNNGVRDGKIITIDVYGISEDIVAETGFYIWYGADKNELTNGKYIVLWKNTINGWQRWRHSYNSSFDTAKK